MAVSNIMQDIVFVIVRQFQNVQFGFLQYAQNMFYVGPYKQKLTGGQNGVVVASFAVHEVYLQRAVGAIHDFQRKVGLPEKRIGRVVHRIHNGMYGNFFGKTHRVSIARKQENV